MKVLILCGGKGTRMGVLSEELPKPLIKIGDKPVIWHIMNLFSTQGYTEFILLVGYLGEKIMDYFDKNKEPAWKIQIVDTGIDTNKSLRISQVRNLISEEDFFIVYGDDLADINLYKLRKHHEYTQNVITITAVKLTSPFGILEMDEEHYVTKFNEKPILDHWINGGFMVANKNLFNYLKYGELEDEVFKKLVEDKKIGAYKHNGRWKTMNTLKDNIELNALWTTGDAFWKTRTQDEK